MLEERSVAVASIVSVSSSLAPTPKMSIPAQFEIARARLQAAADRGNAAAARVLAQLAAIEEES